MFSLKKERGNALGKKAWPCNKCASSVWALICCCNKTRIYVHTVRCYTKESKILSASALDFQYNT